jgi:hypothetical protein
VFLEFKLSQRNYYVLQFIAIVCVWVMLYLAVESRNLIFDCVCQHIQTDKHKRTA